MQKIALIVFMVCLLLISCGKEEEAVKQSPENNMLAKTTQPSEAYLLSMLNCIEFTGSHIGDMADAANEAAKRLISGGRLFITDDESLGLSGEDHERISEAGVAYTIHENSGGFVAEACDRAGGFAAIKPLPADWQVSANDVVLIGTLDLAPDQQVKQIADLKESGALVILIGSRKSHSASSAHYLIDNGLGVGMSYTMKMNGIENGPIAGAANIFNMWTFSAELVGAFTRLGKMPTHWQSMFVPGAEARNERIGKSAFELEITVDPVPSGELGGQYVKAIRGYLENIRDNELPKIAEAGKLCAATISQGNEVVCWLIGHFMTSQERMPGFPAIFKNLEHTNIPEQVEEHLDSSDVFLHIGYSYYPEQVLQRIREIGAKTVCVMTPGPKISGEGEPEQPDMSLIDILIDPYWKHGDAAVEVPGYDTKIIPPSGVVMVTCYWMILIETQAASVTSVTYTYDAAK
ncbi:hypothetical protein ACFL47_04235 [Candidatus Latescibacterota bacterium]